MSFYKRVCFWIRQLNPWHPLTQACKGVEAVHDGLYDISIEFLNGHELCISLWNQFGLPCMLPHQLIDYDVTGSIKALQEGLPGTYIDYITYEQMYCTASQSPSWYIGFHVAMWPSVYLVIPCHAEDTLLFTYQKAKQHLPPSNPPPYKPAKNKEHKDHV